MAPLLPSCGSPSPQPTVVAANPNQSRCYGCISTGVRRTATIAGALGRLRRRGGSPEPGSHFADGADQEHQPTWYRYRYIYAMLLTLRDQPVGSVSVSARSRDEAEKATLHRAGLAQSYSEIAPPASKCTQWWRTQQRGL
eukprot:scaffold2879_cov269-Prasinococcus_capsulatus_cf.AAC.36